MWKVAAIIVIFSVPETSAQLNKLRASDNDSSILVVTKTDTAELKAFRDDIFAHLNYKKHYVDQHNPLMDGDVICNCTTNHCDSELVDLMGESKKGLCRGKLCRLSHRHIMTEKGYVESEKIYECIEKENMEPLDRPFVCHSNQFNVVYCCNGTLCASEVAIEDPDELDIHSPYYVAPRKPAEWSEILIAILIFLCFVVAIMVAMVILQQNNEPFRNFTSKIYHRVVPPIETSLPRYPDEENVLLEEPPSGTISTLLRDLETTTSGSGSGSGLPLLIQRTIALQIELKHQIGQGRYGEVKLGVWRGENVAVKIFSSRDERSFAREVDIFDTNMLRHSNVLQYIASDRKDTGMITQLWLITEYQQNGSLFDYLQDNTVEEVVAVQMVRAIAHGMQFLHSEIPCGFLNKPAIAHRDIKSKNILVKRDLTCVIADLGLAVKYEMGRINLPDNNKCGTARYLAPELLNDTFVPNRFESYRTADMYAVGLCMWEIARRTRSITGTPADFEEAIPYFEHVARDPSLEEMQLVVSTNGLRPQSSSHWKNNHVLSELYRVMSECWNPNPAARLTAMNVKLAMEKIARLNNLHLSL